MSVIDLFDCAGILTFSSMVFRYLMSVFSVSWHITYFLLFVRIVVERLAGVEPTYPRW